MYRGFSVGIFPPVYDVSSVGDVISNYLKGSCKGYSKNYKETKLFGTVLEFKPLENIGDTSTVTIMNCLNPNKITGLATRNCTMVLFKTPSDLKHIQDISLTRYCSVIPLEEYLKGFENEYKTSIVQVETLNNSMPCSWLETMNKKCLMLLRFESVSLWDYKVDSCNNILMESTDYMIEFVKDLTIDGEIFHANLGWFVSKDEDGDFDIQRLHTLASETDIKESNGKCLRINHNRKRFLEDLSCLTLVTEKELEMLDSFGDALISEAIKEHSKKIKPFKLFSIVQ